MYIFRYYKYERILPMLIAVALIFSGLTLCPSSSSAVSVQPGVAAGNPEQGGIGFSLQEGGPGAFAARPLGNPGVLIVKCPAGVSFSVLPEISVMGDLALDQPGIRLNRDGDQLTIPILRSSTETSTIFFQQVKLTVDRTVPEGPVVFRVGGSAVDWSSAAAGTMWNITVAKDAVAWVTTPAPDEQNAEAGFTIGSLQFVLNGANRDMDLAPYVKDQRTFVPLYYAALGLGISESGIVWDGEQQSVTLIKGDKLVQIKIGSTTMLVNGAAVTLDAAPEINNGRTCLPVALLATVLGETATWNAETQTIVIK